MKGIKIIILVLMLSSCATRYITPPLPDFNPIRPERPQLEEVAEDVPVEAVMNTVRLIGYSEQLEQYCDSWENFYRSLQEEFNDGKV